MEKLHELSRTTVLRSCDLAHSRVLTPEKTENQTCCSQYPGNPTKQEFRRQTECACTKPETAEDDGPDADTSTSPIPRESAARKRSADASCISRAHLLQSGQSIRPAVASLPRSPVHPSLSRSSPSSNCGAVVATLNVYHFIVDAFCMAIARRPERGHLQAANDFRNTSRRMSSG